MTEVPTQTRAAVLTEIGRPLELMPLTLPALKPGQVLVDVAYSGLCRSQLNEIDGNKGPDPYIPHALGHEGSGTVLATGEGVTKVSAGDRVVLTWLKGAGADVPGSQYESAIGTVNSGAIATFMTVTVTCENRLVPIPDDMPLKEAALLGCAMPTGGGIVLNTLKLRKGDSVAVFGAGGVGLSAIAAAAMEQAGRIIAVDIHPQRLARAERLGATDIVHAGEEDPLDAILRLTDGKGADHAVEAVGRAEVMSAALASVRPAGGLCVIAGNPPVGTTFDVDPYDLIKGKRLLGSWGGDGNPDVDIPKYCALYLQGALNLDGLMSETFALEDINGAVDALRGDHVGRPLIACS